MPLSYSSYKKNIERMFESGLIYKLAGFSITGAISSLLSIALLFLFNEICCLNVYLAYILSYIISIIFSYISNALAVWRKPLHFGIFIKYMIVYCSSMIIGTLALSFLKWGFPTGNNTVLSILTFPVTMTWNYVFINKLFSKKNE